MKVALLIVWIGNIPQYFANWLKSAEYNSGFDFLIYTDKEIDIQLPQNVYIRPISLKKFQYMAEKVLKNKVSILKPYRICDFRPMFGQIFKDDLLDYNFWGYCDLDVIFGDLRVYITEDVLKDYDGVLNCGSFTLYRNIDCMNNLYTKVGGLFDYRFVARHDAIFAFDETTGIKQIAKKNNSNVIYEIPYMETEIKHKQLRSRFDKVNPDNQIFYWEKGKVFRARLADGEITYQNIPYIHLQKRKLCGCCTDKEAFWILPDGYHEKCYIGKPTTKDILELNPYLGQEAMDSEIKLYKKKKVLDILKRTPLQIYVRIKQELLNINAADGMREDLPWVKY